MKNKKIQILRGLSIIAVLIIHTFTRDASGVVIRSIVNYAVAMFLFISGYLTKSHYDNVLLFYKKRIGRVIVPYVIWTAVYMLWYGKTDIVRCLLYSEGEMILYYLPVYIQLTLITPLLGKLLKTKYMSVGFVISPLFILVSRYLLPLIGIQINHPIFQVLCVEWLTFYYLGMALGNCVLKWDKSRAVSIGLYASTILFALAEGFVWYKIGNYAMATSQLKLSSVLSSIVVCLIAYQYLISKQEQYNFIETSLAYLGDYSFGMYLAHILVMRVMIKYIQVFTAVPFPVNTLLVLAVTLVILVIAKKILGKNVSELLGIA